MSIETLACLSIIQCEIKGSCAWSCSIRGDQEHIRVVACDHAAGEGGDARKSPRRDEPGDRCRASGRTNDRRNSERDRRARRHRNPCCSWNRQSVAGRNANAIVATADCSKRFGARGRRPATRRRDDLRCRTYRKACQSSRTPTTSSTEPIVAMRVSSFTRPVNFAP